MRYRMLDADGDYVFGSGQLAFWVDRPEGVAQAVLTRLQLWQGQWFADLTQGTPWGSEVLGERTQGTRDLVVQSTVLETPGVSDIAAYFSVVDPQRRSFAVALTIDTVYGRVQLAAGRLPATVPPLPAPFGRAAQLLGIKGNPAPRTETSMNPALLNVAGQQDVSDFRIVRMDAQRF
jgi:hypothetical protein